MSDDGHDSLGELEQQIQANLHSLEEQQGPREDRARRKRRHSSIAPVVKVPEPVEHVDIKSLDYADSALMDQLLCPICQTVFTEPYSTQCGHTFCKQCIESTIAAGDSAGKKFRCPVDRTVLQVTSPDVVPAAYLITSLINDLPVKCPFRSRGCEFEGKRWDIYSHVQDSCEYVHVECGGHTDDGICTKPVERRHWLWRDRIRNGMNGNDDNNYGDDDGNYDGNYDNDNYDNDNGYDGEENGDGGSGQDDELECLHVAAPCPQCQKYMPRYKIQAHMDSDCDQVMRKCSGCSRKIPQPDLSKHEQVCPEVIIPCAASQFGCLWSGKRMDFHNNHALSCHMVALAPMLARQDTRMKMLEDENRSLRYHVERLMTQTAGGVVAGKDLSISKDNNAPSTFSDSDLLHMFMECERLRRDVDRLATTLGELEVKQGMMFMRENCRNAEELTALRAGFNSLRHQLHFLLTERRQVHIRPDQGPSRNLSELFRQDVKL